ncbi:MAG: dATP pyrophosphohydrolase [Parvularculaceae bacterium]
MTVQTEAAAPARVKIQPVATRADRRVFIRAVAPIYADDPAWIAPLEFELGQRLDAAKNPALTGAPHQLWIAWREGRPVGRVAAIVNPLHLERYDDATGHFGFLESIDDADVFQALIETAEGWLKDRGMKRIAGPYNFSVNEECGMLIDGFDTPPFIMMPHGRPYYQAHIEALGYAKAQDMYALAYDPVRNFIPERRKRFVEKILSNPKVRIRTLDMKNFTDDLKTAIDIYNDAWSENWGFIPFTDAQAEHMAGELRPIISPENFVLCYFEDKPAAFGIVLPDINEAIADFGGKLLPFNWARLLWRLKVSGVKSARMPLMGVRRKLHAKPVGAAFAYKIIDMVNDYNIDRGVVRTELSWILESNTSMVNMLTEMGGRIYKTYRIYEKGL